MKDKTRSTKLIHGVYSAESEQLLAKGEDFFFHLRLCQGFDSVLEYNKRRTSYDGCYCWNLQIIEESTQVSQMHCRHEIGHITNDLHAFMDLDWDYLQTKWA